MHLHLLNIFFAWCLRLYQVYTSFEIAHFRAYLRLDSSLTLRSNFFSHIIVAVEIHDALWRYYWIKECCADVSDNATFELLQCKNIVQRLRRYYGLYEARSMIMEEYFFFVELSWEKLKQFAWLFKLASNFSFYLMKSHRTDYKMFFLWRLIWSNI